MKIRLSRNLPFLIRVYFIVGGIILAVSMLYYNNTLISRMKKQAENTTNLFSRFTALALSRVENSGSRQFVREIREAMILPLVITDAGGRPMIWNEIGIPQMEDSEYSRLLDFDPESPDDPLLEQVLEKVRSFDAINKPIPVRTNGQKLMIHYGLSGLARELKIAPYVQLGVFLIFALFGFIGFQILKKSEQRSIWVGMSKETAHQLGTPISSLMGWLEIIKGELRKDQIAREKIDSSVREAELDVERLSRISSRFSKIGSAPRMEYQDIGEIILRTVEYFKRRRPALSINSIITVKLEELPEIRCSADLIGWVFENLIKNSLDAISGGEGRIEITGRLNERNRSIEIQVSDTGSGIPPALRNRIFSPGITTKRRGWGLGLALVKRIVEEIHKGSISLADSELGRGTTFLLKFPVH
ncbi:MAG: two-component sensor histidine kinase [Candidatus Latescibacteria bacterium]|nr:two-component sensor histidine kinase [bacterium]MBD3425051.1 two-component sensor histidine kinase [Candidatus Latescibacterota bacterium]